jgi:hypothetical protein
VTPSQPVVSHASAALLLTVAACVCFVIAVLVFTGVFDSSLEDGLAWATGGWLALSLRFLP